MKKTVLTLAIIAAVSFAFTKATVKKSASSTEKVNAKTVTIKKAAHALKVTKRRDMFFQVGDGLIPDGSYSPNTTLCTQYWGFKMVYQSDGNLVLYSVGPNARALWSSDTQVSDPLYAQFDYRGILLVRGTPGHETVYWLSVYPNALPGTIHRFVVQTDGNFVFYVPNTVFGSVASGTVGGAVSSHFGILE